MTKEEAINVLQEIDADGHPCSYEPQKTITAIQVAIKAISQINVIKAIINKPMYIQEDVLRYQMVCEVVKE